jgi:hypothetical protein
MNGPKGNHLQPDRKRGREYLSAIRVAVRIAQGGPHQEYALMHNLFVEDNHRKKEELAVPENLETMEALIESNRLTEAHSRLESALLRQPDQPEVLIDLAVVASLEGDLHGARAITEKCLRIDPSNQIAQENLMHFAEQLRAQDGRPEKQPAKQGGGPAGAEQFRLRFPVNASVPFNTIKQLKIDLVGGIGEASSIRDYGGLWGVFGLYLLEGAKALHCSTAEMVDVTPRPQFDEAVAALKRALPITVTMVQADFRDAALFKTLRPVDVSLLYDVLLHQDDAVEVMKNVAGETTKCVCIAQPVLKEEVFPLPNGTVNLQFYPEELKDMLRFPGWWHKEPTTPRFSTSFWMWGQTVSYLKSVMQGYGWMLSYREVYELSPYWNYALLRFVPEDSR